MESIKELMSTIKAKKDLATQVPEENAASYRVKLGKIKRAKEDLNDLYLQYRKEVQQRASLILVTGKKAKTFAKNAHDDFGCFSYNIDDFYEMLISDISPRLYENKSTNSALFDMVNNKLAERADQIEIISLPSLIFQSKYKTTTKNKKEFIELIKKAFNSAVGIEVPILDVIDKTAKEAVNEEFDQKVVPIVVQVPENMVKETFDKASNVITNVFMVSTDGASEETVKHSFHTVKSATKKQVEEALMKIRERLLQ